MPSVPTPPRDTGWTLSATVSVYPSYAASRVLYYVWRPRGAQKAKDLTLRMEQPRISTVAEAVDSLIAVLEAYRRTLE